LANNWLKPKALTGGGYASTYATKADFVEKKKTGEKGTPKKEQTPGAKQGADSEGEKKKRTKKLECFICGDEHYASNCPHRKTISSGKADASYDEEEGGFVNAAWDANAFHTARTYQVDSAGRRGFTMTEVLLDNQADISIVWPELLRAIWPISETVKVKGVGGVQLKLNQVGYLQDFFEVYSSNKARVNILSFTEVEEMYPLSCVPHEGFVVHMGNKDVLIKRRGKMHVADFREFTALATQMYTKGEVAQAQQVMELIRTCGYPSYTELGYMLRDGNITNVPNLTVQDIRRACERLLNLCEGV
jgi:hypothetical protein